MKNFASNTLIAVVIGTMVGSVISTLTVFVSLNSKAFYYLATDTIWLFSIGCFAAGFTMLIYGIPVYLILYRLNKTNWFTAILVGAVPGMLSLILGDNRLSIPILISGVSIAIVFYWLMSRNKLDKLYERRDLPDSLL